MKFTFLPHVLRLPHAPVTLVILVGDGARPDTLFAAMDGGELQALAALRAEGAAYTVSSVFPSVTGAAYTPFLLGLHPGRAGLPGLRWYDRSRRDTLWPAHSRSYVGIGGMRADHDLSPTHRTLFEAEPRSLGGFTYVGRGLRGARRIGSGLAFGARLAWTHFRGDLDGWMRFDRWLGEEFVRRIVAQQPRVAFLAHPGIDKLSHRYGQEHPRVLEAMRTVDATVRRLREAFRGRDAELEIWVVSDHGHAAVHTHEDLAGIVAGWGFRVRAHPWVFGGDDVAVMVSGNAMAHLYCDLTQRERPWWDALRPRFEPLLARLLERPSVDLVLAPLSEHAVLVHRRHAGGIARARVSRDAAGLLSYERLAGDPLQLGADLHALDPSRAWECSAVTEYPDALMQIAAIAAAPRAGDLIISAAHGYDLRARWEPVNHVSGHGALLREQMLVPWIVSRALDQTPRRTTDVFATALARLGIAPDADLDGEARAGLRTA